MNCQLTAGLVAITVLSGCKVDPLLTYQPDSAATVTLPLARSGVADRRAEFSRIFDDELRHSTSPHRLSESTKWLHNVDRPETLSGEAKSADVSTTSKTSVLIVPGILGDCVDNQSLPFSDGKVRIDDNAVAGYHYLRTMGLASIRALPVLGRAPSEYNSKIVAREILAEAAAAHIDQIILVAYSKGVPDAQQGLALLQNEGLLPNKVKALVAVAGVVMGTPIADANANRYAALSPWVNPLTCSVSVGNAVHSLSRAARGQWMARNPMPSQIRTYSIVAHTRESDISPGLRFSHRELSFADPRNDGQVIMTDAILPGSALLAEAKSDHWTFVLPLAESNEPAIRALATAASYPRAELFRAAIRIVLADLSVEDPHEIDTRQNSP